MKAKMPFVLKCSPKAAYDLEWQDINKPATWDKHYDVVRRLLHQKARPNAQHIKLVTSYRAQD